MITNNKKLENLYPYSIQLSTTKLVLLTCLDAGFFDAKKKEDAIYIKALVNLCITDSRAADDFLYGINSIRYRNHKKDKNGKLVSVEAYLPKDDDSKSKSTKDF